MAEYRDQDLHDSRFERVNLRGSTFYDSDLSDVTFRAVEFHRMTMRGVELCDVDITGELLRVRINGVDVAPLVTAELDRRDPERTKMRPEDPDGFREAWTIVERRWDSTLARARQLPPERLDESVAGEWSFIQTLRHLVYATDCWVARCILGNPAPWHRLALPWDEMPDSESFSRDREARPTLEEVLEIRRDRMATVRRVLDDLTPEQLASDTEPVEAPGWPPPEAFPVKECLLIVLNEEWEHRNYAERDLARL